MVCTMPAKKMRVEVSDGQGNRYTMTFEGEVTREKVLCMLDVIELLGGVRDNQKINSDEAQLSKFDKMKALVERHFSLGWFSSKEVLSAYEQELHEPVSLSTVSTYLKRMANRGILMRIDAVNNKKYQVVNKRFVEHLKLRKTHNR
jgi:hypothetical protein